MKISKISQKLFFPNNRHNRRHLSHGMQISVEMRRICSLKSDIRDCVIRNYGKLQKKPNFCIFDSRLLKRLSNLGHMDILIWYEFGEHISPNKKVGFFFAFLTFLDLGGTRGISEFPEKPVLMLPKNYWAFYNPKGSAKKTDLRNFVVFMPISQNWPKTATFWKNWV